jgi:hypothetical protein
VSYISWFPSEHSSELQSQFPNSPQNKVFQKNSRILTDRNRFIVRDMNSRSVEGFGGKAVLNTYMLQISCVSVLNISLSIANTLDDISTIHWMPTINSIPTRELDDHRTLEIDEMLDIDIPDNGRNTNCIDCSQMTTR